MKLIGLLTILFACIVYLLWIYANIKAMGNDD